MTDSCFLAKLGHFIDLTEQEKDALRTLEESPRTYGPGEVLFEEGDTPADNLYVVAEGRLHSSTTLADGGRAILSLYYPGDLIGTNSVAFETSAVTTLTSVESTLCRFPRSGLKTLFAQFPRLAALFYAIAALENVSLQDRLKSIGRTNGKVRIGALILEILYRLRLTNEDLGNRVELCLTQADIGDAVGLTNVHVHRCLKELEQEGLIERGSGAVTVVHPDLLAERSDFVDRWRNIDTSWFPDPTHSA